VSVCVAFNKPDSKVEEADLEILCRGGGGGGW